MIMPRGADQLLLPVNPLFIVASLVFALGFNLIPLGRQAAMPDLLALVLVFWNVHQPLRVGVGIAFVLGLLMDVHQGALVRPACARLHAAEFSGRDDPPPLAVVLGVRAGAAGVAAAGRRARRGARRAAGVGRQPARMAIADRADHRGGVVAGGGVDFVGSAAPCTRSGREPAAITGAGCHDDRTAQCRIRAGPLPRPLDRGRCVRPVRVRPARSASVVAAGLEARRAVDAGRGEPHRGGADRAEPRPDPRPQRRRAGHQLLGLHAGDHAVEAERHRPNR